MFTSGKQIANRHVRRKTDLPQFSGYRKAFESYDISDFSFRMSENDLKKDWESGDSWLHSRFATYEEAFIWWRITYISK